jgi:hypothetical protein
MKFGTATVLTVLLGCLAPPAEAQTSARIFVVMVDDLRFKPSVVDSGAASPGESGHPTRAGRGLMLSAAFRRT